MDTESASAAAPVLAPESDSGTSNTDNLTNVSHSVMVSAEANGGSSVLIYDGDSLLDEQNALNDQVAFSLNLAEGDHTLRTRVRSVAGVLSDLSPSLNIKVDTSAPGRPGAPDLLAASDSGSSNTDNLTNTDSQLSLMVTGEANSTLILYDTSGHHPRRGHRKRQG